MAENTMRVTMRVRWCSVRLVNGIWTETENAAHNPQESLPPGEDEGLTIEKLASLDAPRPRILFSNCTISAAEPEFPLPDSTTDEWPYWLHKQPLTMTAETATITDAMVERGVKALGTKYPGLYQAMKEREPATSLRVVVADILRAALS